MPRTATIHRKTAETDIRLSINLDGRGKSRIATGVRFLDHMLDLVARHGAFDLDIAAKGDLSALDTNVVAMQILDAARTSARTGKTVRLTKLPD